MEFKFVELIGIFIVHYFGDFIFQKQEDALNKWNNFKHLINHTATYSFIFFVFISLILTISAIINNVNILYALPLIILGSVCFTTVTFILHTLTDFVTSKLSHKYFNVKDYHMGFVVVGADQLLHYIQLLLTYYIIFGNY